MSVLLLSLLIGVGAPQPDDPVQVIRKAADALGERDVKGEVAFRTTSKLTLNGGPVHRRVQTCAVDPDRMRNEETWNQGGRLVEEITVFDGKSGWVKFNGITRAFTPEQLNVVKEMAARGKAQSLWDLTDPKKFKLSLLPETKVDDEPCLGVRVQSEKQPDTDLYFSKDTCFLRKTVGKKLLPDGKTYELVEYHSDYKRFSGQLHATRKVTYVGPVGPLEETIENVEFIPVNDVDKLFEKP